MANEKSYDVIMIGSGPASLTAAIYSTREELTTLIIEKGAIGGMAATTDEIENYPGFPEGVAGLELAQLFEKQAERFGAEIILDEVINIYDEKKYKIVKTATTKYRARAVLIASGSDYRKLNIPGEEEYYGRGVHYCATCDGAFYKDKSLVVIGGGDSAAQEALFLSRFSKKIDVLVRDRAMIASEILQERLKNNPAIRVHYSISSQEIMGEKDKVTGVKAINTNSQEEVVFKTDGVFVFIGLVPNTSFLTSSGVVLDDYGFIKTDEKLMTNIIGLFAAGDVRSGSDMQVITAAGEGASAAISIRHYLENP